MNRRTFFRKLGTITNCAIEKSSIYPYGDTDYWNLIKSAFRQELRDAQQGGAFNEVNQIYQEKDNPELGRLFDIHLGLCNLLLHKVDNAEYEDFWCEHFCIQSLFSIQTPVIHSVGCYMVAQFLNTCEESGFSFGSFSLFSNAA